MNEIGPAPPQPAPDPSDGVSRLAAPGRTRPGSRRSVLLAFVLLIVAGGVTVAVGLVQPWFHTAPTVPPAQSGSAAPLVTTARVQRRPMIRSLEVAGSLVGRHEVPIGAQASGSRIDAVLVDVGDAVAKGQVLARLDATIQQVRLNHARAEIQAATAAATAAEAAYQRVAGIRNTGAVSAQQVEQRRADATTAEAHLAEARAETEEIAAQLEQLVVRAPVAGVIVARNAEPGAIVASGGPPLFELIEGGVVDFDAQVPQEQLAGLAPGMPVEVDLGTPDGTQGATGEGTLGATIEGLVRTIAPTVNPHTRLGVVHIALPRDPRLRPGAFVQGRIILSRSPVLSVPLSAVLWRGGGSFVYVVADGRVQGHAVQIGAVRAGRVVIRSGLAAGDDVVLSAGAFLHEGEAVRQAAGNSADYDPLPVGHASRAECHCEERSDEATSFERAHGSPRPSPTEIASAPPGPRNDGGPHDAGRPVSRSSDSVSSSRHSGL